jgi:hypothetical protein
MLAANKGMLWNLENRSLIYSILILFTNSGNWPCPLRPLWKCNEELKSARCFVCLSAAFCPHASRCDQSVGHNTSTQWALFIYFRVPKCPWIGLAHVALDIHLLLPPPRQFIRLIISMTQFCSWSRLTQHLLSAWSRFYPSQATSRWFWRLWLCTLSLPFFAFLCIYVVICCILFFCCFWYSFSFIKLPAFLALG